MNIGLEDQESIDALRRAVDIVNDNVDTLCDSISKIAYSEDCEISRIAHELPAGPISFDRTIFAAIEAVRGALDQISYIILNDVPTSAIALHSLLRAALVGSGRVIFALIDTCPDTRTQNARILIAHESRGFTQALESYAEFNELRSLRPEAHYVSKAQQQNTEIQRGSRPPGDGTIMRRTAEAIAEALKAMPEYSEDSKGVLCEHVIWLWNTYSGSAHTHAWPRLLPSFGGDRRFPGDFPGDFYMVATIAHMAICCCVSRLQPGSANTADPVSLT